MALANQWILQHFLSQAQWSSEAAKSTPTKDSLETTGSYPFSLSIKTRKSRNPKKSNINFKIRLLKKSQNFDFSTNFQLFKRTIINSWRFSWSKLCPKDLANQLFRWTKSFPSLLLWKTKKMIKIRCSLSFWCPRPWVDSRIRPGLTPILTCYYLLLSSTANRKLNEIFTFKL